MPFKPTDRSGLDTAINGWISGSITAGTQVPSAANSTIDDANDTYGEIGTWDVTAVTDMSELFKNKKTFNEDIGDWDVSYVEDMSSMFYSAWKFNKDITGWNVSYVTNMTKMFWDAKIFDQDIRVWSPANNVNMTSMFAFARAMESRYGHLSLFDNTPNRNFFGYTPTFTSFPLMGLLLGESYSYTVSTSDPDGDSVTVAETTIPSWLSFDGTTLSGTAPSTAGLHDVVLTATDSTGAINRQSFTLSVSPESGFQPQTKQQLVTAVNAWISSSITALDSVPSGQGTGYYGLIRDWDITLVTDMSELFKDTNFNEDISGWDVSNVTDMSYMFQNNQTFNNDLLNDWDVSKVTDMSYMFDDAYEFNGDITNWSLAKVTNMEYMFQDARAFSKDIRVWSPTDGVTLTAMFKGAWASRELFANDPDFGTYNNDRTPNRDFFAYQIEFASSAIFYPRENQTTIGTVIASHKYGNSLTYSISGNDANTSNPYHILLNTSTGELTFNSAPDFENPGSAAGTNTFIAEISTLASPSLSITSA